MNAILALSTVILFVSVAISPVLADSSTPFDQRSCVCEIDWTVPRDVFTATGELTDEGTFLRVVDVLAMGPGDRQSPGEFAEGFSIFSPGLM
jgi:hypothetical protein